MSLRYILFHHQTTTALLPITCQCGCVISSFITKPQQYGCYRRNYDVALYPLSSPNHNLLSVRNSILVLRYILFHHQTTTIWLICCVPKMLRYILFHHQTTTVQIYYERYVSLRYILFHHQTTTCISYVL